MIVIKTVDGRDIDGDENAITLIAGPYPHDAGPHTYVHGLTQAPLMTAESLMFSSLAWGSRHRSQS